MHANITQLDCLRWVSLRKSNLVFLNPKTNFALFAKLINPRSLGSGCVKGNEESTLGKDSLVPRMPHDASDVGLTCLVEQRKMRFRI